MPTANTLSPPETLFIDIISSPEIFACPLLLFINLLYRCRPFIIATFHDFRHALRISYTSTINNKWASQQQPRINVTVYYHVDYFLILIFADAAAADA